MFAVPSSATRNRQSFAIFYLEIVRLESTGTGSPNVRKNPRKLAKHTNAWLGQFRRLLVRHEHLLSTYYAFFYRACFWITLKHRL